MNDEEALAALIDQLVLDFPTCPREQIERVTTAAWVVFGSSAATQHGRVRVTNWYARTELAAADQRPSAN